MRHAPLVVMSALLLAVELYSACRVLWPDPPAAAHTRLEPPCGRRGCDCGCRGGESCVKCAPKEPR